METPADQQSPQIPESPKDFKRFATKRMAVVVLLALVALWVIATVAGHFSGRSDLPDTPVHTALDTGHGLSAGDRETRTTHGGDPAPASVHGVSTARPDQRLQTGVHSDSPGGSSPAPVAHAAPAASSSHAAAPSAAAHAAGSKTAAAERAAPVGHEVPAAAGHGATQPKSQIPGVTFVEAVIEPMRHELYDRFWGWRPNDILDFTDNVNNYQLGVLEVTRRTAVILAERISRAGSTESFDKNLENAMNWFMVSADKYWFPSPEGKYKEGLDEFAAYRDRLKRGNARFWTRTDNLIPLLLAYEDLLGSCDENLVKGKEDDGSEVSFFAADDYFFYAKGVATALHEILAAIEHDFYQTIDARRGIEVLHHAIESCHHAMEIDPIIITNADLSGILANHRANMAAPISHARFYLSVLIETLST